MKIVAILDIDEEKFKSEKDGNFNFIKDFIGYYNFPSSENEFVVAGKDEFYIEIK